MKSFIPHFLAGLALVVCAAFVGPAEKAVAQTNPDVFYVYTNCNVYPCTIGVAVHGWTSPGWRTLSQSYVGDARAWRAACHFHFDNPRYFSPDINDGVVDCVEMRRQAAVLDRGGSDPPGLGAVCRDLRPGERWYSDWTRCCDLPRGGSRWTKRSDGSLGDYPGSCRSYGIN